jgi:dTDP-4-amino-4,6-dideoxygalactose transaminase
VSIGQFKRLDFLTKHRIELAGFLTKKLSRFKGLIPPREEKGIRHVYFTYPIKFKEGVAGVPRDIFVKALNAEGIPFGAGYVRPIYLDPLYQKKTAYGMKGCPFTCAFYGDKIEYRKGLCPIAERMHEKELILTSICRYPHTKKDMNDAVRSIEKILKNIDKLKSYKKDL